MGTNTQINPQIKRNISEERKQKPRKVLRKLRESRRDIRKSQPEAPNPGQAVQYHGLLGSSEFFPLFSRKNFKSTGIPGPTPAKKLSPRTLEPILVRSGG